jgi:hypothetical protein
MARASVNASGFLDLLDRLEKSTADVQRRAARDMNTEFKRQMSGTKSRTGRLKASLTTDNADHIFEVRPTGIRLGSRDPAARYSPGSIPELDARPFFLIVADYLFRDVKSGGRQRG